jgi:hypothetical protein
VTADKRKTERVAFQPGLGVGIVALDGTWSSDCTMLDASEGGVLLQLDKPPDPSTVGEFFLSLTKTGKAFRRCELSWISDGRIGARFVTQDKKSRKIGSQRRRDMGRSHAAN